MATQPGTPTPPARPLLTLRVSRTGGRTWGPTRRYFAGDCTPLLTSEWPPCRCTRCRGPRRRGR